MTSSDHIENEEILQELIHEDRQRTEGRVDRRAEITEEMLDATLDIAAGMASLTGAMASQVELEVGVQKEREREIADLREELEEAERYLLIYERLKGLLTTFETDFASTDMDWARSKLAGEFLGQAKRIPDQIEQELASREEKGGP